MAGTARAFMLTAMRRVRMAAGPPSGNPLAILFQSLAAGIFMNMKAALTCRQSGQLGGNTQSLCAVGQLDGADRFANTGFADAVYGNGFFRSQHWQTYHHERCK